MKLSVIIPVYNTGHLVRNAILSLRGEGIDCEIICINDGSTDDSFEQLKKIKEEIPAIKIYDKPNEGLSATRNYGINRCSGEYILFLDSDDTVDTELFHQLVENVNNNVDIVHANFIYTFENSTVVKENKPQLIFEGNGQQFINDSLLQDKLSMLACVNLYRKQFLVDHQLYFKKGIYHEDEEFNLRAFSYANVIKSTNIPFYLYLQRQNSITNNQNNLAKRFNDIVWIHQEIYEFITKQSHITSSYAQTVLTYISFMVMFAYCRFEDKQNQRKYYKTVKELNLSRKINSDILMYKLAKYGIKFMPYVFLKSFRYLINSRNKKVNLS